MPASTPHDATLLAGVLHPPSTASASRRHPSGERGAAVVTPVDGWLSYQSSHEFASGQIPRRSQGTLLPLSVRAQGIEFVEQCATQGFNLVRQGNSFEEPSCI
jgi:hypothetical protein